ncbi:unnamed protein product [Nezara viridula]|uniref:Uncharacterized protein n=1 Tax=Nezara viridula TaxID=85310 RepID=A0A9P0HM56_NEZVI|nr:unnamed protein product [Nezara viridula]
MVRSRSTVEALTFGKPLEVTMALCPTGFITCRASHLRHRPPTPSNEYAELLSS